MSSVSRLAIVLCGCLRGLANGNKNLAKLLAEAESEKILELEQANIAIETIREIQK